MDRSNHDAAVIEHADLLTGRRGLALCLVHRIDVLDHLEVLTDARELDGVVALRDAITAGSLDVGLRGAPHEGDHLAQRIALALELLDGDGRCAAEEVRDDEIGLEAAGDVEHLGSHLDARRRHRKGSELEAFRFRKVLEDDEGLLARRVVIEQIGDLLALEAAAQLLLGKGDGRRALRPVAGSDREQIGVALAVRGRGRAEARRGAEDLVLLELLGQRCGLRRAVDALEDRAILLEALVRLHRRRHLVLVVDLDDLDLVALDAALAVEQRDVVMVAGAEVHAHELRGASPVALQPEHDLLLLRPCGTGRQRQSARGDRRHAPTWSARHWFPPSLRCCCTRYQ